MAKFIASNSDLLQFSKRKQTQRTLFNVDEFKAIIENEHVLQNQCEEFLEWNKIPFIRVPDAVYSLIFGNNEIARRIPGHLKKLISSFLKGLPDIIVFKQIEDSIYNKVLCIELKTEKGKISKGQKNFAKQVNVVIIRSFEDFEKQITDFIKG